MCHSSPAREVCHSSISLSLTLTLSLSCSLSLCLSPSFSLSPPLSFTFNRCEAYLIQKTHRQEVKHYLTYKTRGRGVIKITLFQLKLDGLSLSPGRHYNTHTRTHVCTSNGITDPLSRGGTVLCFFTLSPTRIDFKRHRSFALFSRTNCDWLKALKD